MVTFNDLRISEDGQTLVVDCSVDTSAYPAAYITSIVLDYYKNVSTFGTPSSKAYTVYERTATTKTTARFEINIGTVVKKITNFGTNSFSNGIFHIIVKCKDNTTYTTEVGIALDWYLLYTLGMTMVNEHVTRNDGICSDHAHWEQFVLLWFALKLAIETGSYLQVESLWDEFLGVHLGMASGSSVPCGCK